jgi:hypothetical protein
MPISDEQMNTIMQNISENIPTNCSAYDDIQRKSNTRAELLGSNQFNIPSYQAYRNNIEFVNSFTEQVLTDEREYFVKKYSQKVYDFLLSQRLEYRAKQLSMNTESTCKSCPQTNTTGAGAIPPNTCNNPDHRTCSDTTSFFDYLKRQVNTTITRPETTYKKIEYRNEAKELLDKINYGLTILYFVIFVCLMILLVSTNRLFLKQRFMLYLFLFLLPFVFPYLFEGIKFLYRYLFPDTPTRGPSNGFIESL